MISVLQTLPCAWFCQPYPLLLFLLFACEKKTLIPGVAQSIPESIYEFIYKLVLDNVGKDGLKYFSFIFTLALFIAAGNLLGLFPYSFTFRRIWQRLAHCRFSPFFFKCFLLA